MSDRTKKPKGTELTQYAKATAQTNFNDGLARLFDFSDYSDLSVKCGDHEWKVHRAILCPHSTFFKNACKDGFREGNSHVIELKEDDPTLMRQVLLACYTCSYDDTVSGDDNKLDFNARMYAMADKYDMPFLKELSTATFQAQLDGAPVVVPRFLEAVRTIYTTTLSSDRGLRDVLVPALKKHRNTLKADAGFLDLIKSGLADGDFAQDVIAALSQLADPKPELVYYCYDCNNHAPSGSKLILCNGRGCDTEMRGFEKP